MMIMQNPSSNSNCALFFLFSPNFLWTWSCSWLDRSKKTLPPSSLFSLCFSFYFFSLFFCSYFFFLTTQTLNANEIFIALWALEVKLLLLLLLLLERSSFCATKELSLTFFFSLSFQFALLPHARSLFDCCCCCCIFLQAKAWAYALREIDEANTSKSFTRSSSLLSSSAAAAAAYVRKFAPTVENERLAVNANIIIIILLLRPKQSHSLASIVRMRRANFNPLWAKFALWAAARLTFALIFAACHCSHCTHSTLAWTHTHTTLTLFSFSLSLSLR